MATCTLAVATADTGVSPNTSGAFTPALGDLLVVFVSGSASVDGGVGSLTSSIGGFTFSLIVKGIRSGGTDSTWTYVSDALVSSATSQTVTWGASGADETTGTIIHVYRVAGISKSGLAAIRQNTADSGGSGVTCDADFGVACLTDNPTLTMMCNISSPSGMSAPSGWTEDASADVEYATPTFAATAAYRNSGFAGTNIGWGSSATGWGNVILEIDASGGIPVIMNSYRFRSN
jgi:hypothetical protein